MHAYSDIRSNLIIFINLILSQSDKYQLVKPIKKKKLFKHSTHIFSWIYTAYEETHLPQFFTTCYPYPYPFSYI